MTALLWLFLAILGIFETAPDDPDDPDDGPDADDDADEPEDHDEPEEEIRDPIAKIKALTAANARLARRKKQLEKKLAKAGDGPSEETTKQLVSVKLENTFMRAVLARGTDLDLDTLHTLMSSKGFFDAVTFDGETGEPDIDSMSEAIEQAIARYPWVEDPPDDDDAEPVRTPSPKVTTGTGRKRPDPAAENAIDTAKIRERFPALKRRRRV